MNTHIVLATKADLTAIHQLERDCFGDHCYPDFFFRQALDCWGDQMWIARQGERVLGYVLMAPGQEGDGWVLALAVSEAARGQGLARTLMNTALSHAAGRYRQLKLTVDPNNTPAQSLYQKLGFEVIGEEVDYFGPGETRQVMQRT
ncbi:GNAT family N-acetyltransferase [Marinobacter hydrocarbonoclasticus]|nr:GNAT family N-acetyltransferase [Marinobacter nauticus]